MENLIHLYPQQYLCHTISPHNRPTIATPTAMNLGVLGQSDEGAVIDMRQCDCLLTWPRSRAVRRQQCAHPPCRSPVRDQLSNLHLLSHQNHVQQQSRYCRHQPEREEDASISLCQLDEGRWSVRPVDK